MSDSLANAQAVDRRSLARRHHRSPAAIARFCCALSPVHQLLLSLAHLQPASSQSFHGYFCNSAAFHDATSAGRCAFSTFQAPTRPSAICSTVPSLPRSDDRPSTNSRPRVHHDERGDYGQNPCHAATRITVCLLTQARINNVPRRPGMSFMRSTTYERATERAITAATAVQSP